MNRKILARVSAGLLFLLLASVAYRRTRTSLRKLTLNKVKDDLYEIEGDGGNVARVRHRRRRDPGRRKFDHDHEGILATVKSVTSQPVKYVLTTHHHADHSGGNTQFLPTARNHLDC